tara:strand:- start:1699 stop:1896 length:198 start_codon:yes stop_codon:yes gene_type:complete
MGRTPFCQTCLVGLFNIEEEGLRKRYWHGCRTKPLGVAIAIEKGQVIGKSFMITLPHFQKKPVSK